MSNYDEWLQWNLAICEVYEEMEKAFKERKTLNDFCDQCPNYDTVKMKNGEEHEKEVIKGGEGTEKGSEDIRSV